MDRMLDQSVLLEMFLGIKSKRLRTQQPQFCFRVFQQLLGLTYHHFIAICYYYLLKKKQSQKPAVTNKNNFFVYIIKKIIHCFNIIIICNTASLSISCICKVSRKVDGLNFIPKLFQSFYCSFVWCTV